MTIPGIRTSLFMVLAVNSLNCWRFKPDLMVICTLGRDCIASTRSSLALAMGYKTARAAAVAAFSN
jgi:hypothetical protein